MDVLSRVRDLLSGRKTQKRKSSIFDENKFDDSKKIRMSELNGDSQSELHSVNSENNFHSTAPITNNYRRSESFVNSSRTNYYTPSFGRGRLNNQNASNINSNDGYRNEFKQPSIPAQVNGRALPALIPAKPAVDRIFHRNFKPQQTVNPQYNNYGGQSELSNFSHLPELYPVRSNRSNMSNSISGLANGHEQSSISFSKHNQRYTPNSSGVPTSSSFLASANSLFKKNGDKSSSWKSGSTFMNNGPAPRNLSRSRYQTMLDMIPGYSLLNKCKHFGRLSHSKTKKNAAIESSVRGFIDLSEEDIKGQNTASSSSPVPNVERVNSLKTRLSTNEILKENWEQELSDKYSLKQFNRRDSVKQLEQENEACEQQTRDTEAVLKETFDKITISSIQYEEEEEEEEPPKDYPPLDNEKQNRIVQSISGRDSSTVLISKFNLSITRHDIQTLQWSPLTWLNDEVINFFMELLAERSRTNEKLPKVHGMNTFFLKRLQENGYAGVRRWTRKVDIFAHDIIPIPVHKGIHWCMAIIHMKNKTIKYYDSMGTPNSPVLSALAEYLRSESLDKKKVEFDMTGWTTENVRDIPQQENGSDCGVFSCMYAEFVTRNRPIVFSQQHMQYFRMKMVYEICTGQMLN